MKLTTKKSSKSIQICDNCHGEGGNCPKCRGAGRIIKIEIVEYIPYTKLDWDKKL